MDGNTIRYIHVHGRYIPVARRVPDSESDSEDSDRPDIPDIPVSETSHSTVDYEKQQQQRIEARRRNNEIISNVRDVHDEEEIEGQDSECEIESRKRKRTQNNEGQNSDEEEAECDMESKKRKRAQIIEERELAYVLNPPLLERAQQWQFENEGITDPKEIVQKWHYVPPALIRSIERLRQPHELEECWGCVYGDPNDGSVCAQRWNILVDLFCDMVLINVTECAKQMYEYFCKKIRDITNKALEPGQKPVANWSPYKIILHFLFEAQYPRCWVIRRILMWECLMMTTFLNESVEEHKDTRRERTSIVGLKKLEIIQKNELILRKCDPKKMTFYNSNFHICPEEGHSIINRHKRFHFDMVPTQLYQQH